MSQYEGQISRIKKVAPIVRGGKPKISLAEKNGPGTWRCMHTMTLYAKTKCELEYTIDMLYLLIEGFPCDKCRKHGLEYLRENPLEYNNELSLEDNLSRIFTYTVDFHNDVNRRLGKEEMSYDVASIIYNIDYDNSEACDMSCDESN